MGLIEEILARRIKWIKPYKKANLRISRLFVCPKGRFTRHTGDMEVYMGYVAVQGGITAIENAEQLSKYMRLKGESMPLDIRQIIDQLRFLVDRVMAEGSLYSPYHAALAIKQSEGDPLEAAFYLRAYRSTLKRLGDSMPLDMSRARINRRISSAFKDIPGGQILGATPDYKQRILDFSLAEEDNEARSSYLSEFTGKHAAGQGADNDSFSKVVDILRSQGLAAEAGYSGETPESDITREAVCLPAHRSARLQMMSRSETGGILAMAYSSMRGYGSIHPTVAELRVAFVPVAVRHPYREGEILHIGSIQITEAEIVARFGSDDKDDKPRFTLGYGVSFGASDVRAISMAVLDRTMKENEPGAPAQDQEFVLMHTDGIESSGFCAHFKLPHYITFQSELNSLRVARCIRENDEQKAEDE
jgi:alpha-D-ribose 1-methylphosphonate 5-triphosphate synthase subunit PhnI